MPQLGEHCQHIAGCSSRICLKHRIALSAHSVLRKINQQLTQRCYVIIAHKLLLLSHLPLLARDPCAALTPYFLCTGLRIKVCRDHRHKNFNTSAKLHQVILYDIHLHQTIRKEGNPFRRQVCVHRRCQDLFAVIDKRFHAETVENNAQL